MGKSLYLMPAKIHRYFVEGLRAWSQICLGSNSQLYYIQGERLENSIVACWSLMYSLPLDAPELKCIHGGENSMGKGTSWDL